MRVPRQHAGLFGGRLPTQIDDPNRNFIPNYFAHASMQRTLFFFPAEWLLKHFVKICASLKKIKDVQSRSDSRIDESQPKLFPLWVGGAVHQRVSLCQWLTPSAGGKACGEACFSLFMALKYTFCSFILPP